MPLTCNLLSPPGRFQQLQVPPPCPGCWTGNADVCPHHMGLSGCHHGPTRTATCASCAPAPAGILSSVHRNLRSCTAGTSQDCCPGLQCRAWSKHPKSYQTQQRRKQQMQSHGCWSSLSSDAAPQQPSSSIRCSINTVPKRQCKQASCNEIHWNV